MKLINLHNLNNPLGKTITKAHYIYHYYDVNIHGALERFN